MILHARVLLPISSPPIHNGAVWIEGKRIEAVGRWTDLRPGRQRQAGGAGEDAGDPSEVLDLGEVVLLPGLVNAHCHLDYTHMAGQFLPPKVFSDWLKIITETKAGWNLSDYAASWQTGAQMLLRAGTTTVADIEVVPELLPEAWQATPMRVISFLEMIGITGRRKPSEVLEDTLNKVSTLRHERCRAGLSPHAPYSTLPELLRLAGQAARKRRLRVCTHVSESRLEFSMFAKGEGAMFDWLQRSGRDMSDCGLGSPVQHLERCGLLADNLLAAHVNYLGRKDAALLSRNRVSVVHCPRSHSYFRHGPFPLRRLTTAGVNICLGTDSLASVHKTRNEAIELSLFDEMQVLASREPWLSSQKILQMATLNGARALGLQSRVGELVRGAFADLIAIPLPGKISNIYETVLHHQGGVTASIVDGRWAIAPSA